MRLLFTVPNYLTISRILLLPLFIVGFFLGTEFGLTLSLVVFVVCCITDYFDGYYARMYKQVTKIGQMLDPLADKILVSIAILFIVGFGLVSKYAIIPASVIMCREIIISGVRDAAEVEGAPVKTSWLSKWKTATQMFSIAVILFAAIEHSSMLLSIGEAMFWLSSIIAAVSGIIYCKKHVFN